MGDAAAVHAGRQTGSTPQEGGTSSSKLGVDLLKIIHAARQTYGLRTNDYARYHRHATRRIATLHRATRTVNASSAKRHPAGRAKGGSASKAGGGPSSASSSSSGRTSTTSQITAQAAAKDERLLELLLWEAERAWAEAMREREEVARLERAGSQAPLASKRHRYLRRFQRAAAHASALLSICRELYSSPDDPLSASAAFQVQIYQLYLAGMHGFARASTSSSGSATASSPSAAGEASVPAPVQALQALSQAYVLLEAFGEDSQRATDEALAFEMLDELEPMIRFCAYKSDRGQGLAAADVARDTVREALPRLEASASFPGILDKYRKEQQHAAKARRRDVKPVTQLAWRDLNVPVRSAELAEALGKVQEALQLITRRKGKTAAGTYERVLAVLIEAEERARKLVEDNATALAQAHSSRFESAAKPLRLAHSYITFQLVSVRLNRDEALLQSTLARLARREAKSGSAAAAFGPRPMSIRRKRIKLYPVVIKLLEGMVQSSEALRDLDLVDEDTLDLADQVEAVSLHCRARRAVYLGETYALLGRFPQALSLLQRGSLYVRQMQGASTQEVDVDVKEPLASVNDLASLVPDLVKVSALRARLQAEEARASKDWFIREKYGEAVPQAMASDDLASDVQHLALVRTLERKQKRQKRGPIVFDVAYNYLASIDTAAEAEDFHLATEEPLHAAQDVQAAISKAVASVQTAVDEATPNGDDGKALSKDAAPSRGLWGLFGRR